MSPLAIGFSGLIGLFILIGLRFPIGIALGLVSVIGLSLLVGHGVAFNLLGIIPYTYSAHWTLSAIPMFLFMGSIAYYSGLTKSLYETARIWLGGLPGGLAVASNVACAAFAAASGSSLASSIAMGRIAIPEMLRFDYDDGLATSVVGCAGTLGSLIPPSVLMILYGVYAQVSISKLFIAGVLPGILTAFVYSVMIITRCHFKPSLAPSYREKITWRLRISSLGKIWPLPLLILAVIGSIYGGLVTATEAGALGAAFAILMALAMGRLSWKILWKSATEALKGTASIFFVAIGATLLTRFFEISGVSQFLTHLIKETSISPVYMMAMISIIYLILGMFLEPVGLMLLTLPIMLPIFDTFHLNSLWIGIIVIKYIEIGLITPPVGLNIYAVSTVVGDRVPIGKIFRGATWFLLCEAVVMTLLFMFPIIVTLLPTHMGSTS